MFNKYLLSWLEKIYDVKVLFLLSKNLYRGGDVCTSHLVACVLGEVKHAVGIRVTIFF